MANIYGTPYKDNYVLNFLIALSGNLNNHVATLKQLQLDVSDELPQPFNEHLCYSFYLMSRLRKDLSLLLEEFAQQHDEKYPQFAQKIRDCKETGIEVNKPH